MFAAPIGHGATSANDVTENVESDVEDETSCDEVSLVAAEAIEITSISFNPVYCFRTRLLPRQT